LRPIAPTAPLPARELATEGGHHAARTRESDPDRSRRGEGSSRPELAGAHRSPSASEGTGERP